MPATRWCARRRRWWRRARSARYASCRWSIRRTGWPARSKRPGRSRRRGAPIRHAPARPAASATSARTPTIWPASSPGSPSRRSRPTCRARCPAAGSTTTPACCCASRAARAACCGARRWRSATRTACACASTASAPASTGRRSILTSFASHRSARRRARCIAACLGCRWRPRTRRVCRPAIPKAISRRSPSSMRMRRR